MNKAEFIGHRDLVRAGYLFFDKGQEKRFIDSLNRELVSQARDKLAPVLSSEWRRDIDKKPVEESLNYMISNLDSGKQTIKDIKRDILTRITKQRRIILLKGVED